MGRGTVRALLAAVIVAAGGTVQAQSWPFELRWEHDGTGLGFFEICIDGQCQPVDARRVSGSTWGCPLPAMREGEHRLVVRACNTAGCATSQPDVFVRVLPVATGPSQPTAPPPSKAKPTPRWRQSAKSSDVPN
jgi:hypothetical protein